jgi:small subunit ribosomal protein S21
MLIVKIKDGDNLDKALKELKLKVRKTRMVQQLKEREFYLKPSARKRASKQKAIHRDIVIAAEDLD